MFLKRVFSLLTLLVIFCSASASLYEVFVPCCHEGIKWSSISYRCDNYPAPVVNITDSDQAACLSIIEVCCIKQTQLTTCEQGKQMAIDGEVCAIRDADPGAEQFRECCQCCRLGLESRQSRPACQSPGLGEPCDTKYQECCLGEATGQTNFTGTRLTTPTTESPGGGSEEVGSSTTSAMPSTSPSTVPDSAEESTTIPATTQPPVKSTGRCREGHSCQHRCVDSLGGYKRCQCYSGFRLQQDGTSCMDINECEEGTGRCASSQRCVNTIGRYTCLNTRCLPGSVYDARTRRCVSSGQQCQPGFAFNTVSGRCEDLNECGLGTDSCKVGERCENTVGSYTCRRIHHCGTGYTLDDVSQRCVDNDECQMGTHDCRGGYRCQNIQGSYRCVPKPCNASSKFDHIKGECVPVECPKGFKSNGARRCVDINECTDKGRSACRRFQRCINTRGSFYCRNIVNCPPGYEATEKDRCEDVDECVRGTHKCGPEQQCINRQGTYFCQCPRGLRHDNLGRCIDVDECSYGASICPSNTKCTNTLGSYKCECVDGLQNGDGDGDSCQDVDECAQQGICQQSCVNVLGTFFCTCDAGYQLRDDKRSCEDIDECTQFGGRGGSVCAGNCINVPGSYRCDCPDGLRLNDDGKSCEDINECTDGSAFCPNQDSICINTKGGYKCPVVRCPEGFLKTNSSIQQNRGSMTEQDSVICRKGRCKAKDRRCRRNKTKTISWQFVQLPSLEFIRAPVPIVNVQTTGYSVYPNLLMRITHGNREGFFQTSVMGDKASLMLIKPMRGPTEKELTMVLENWDDSAKYLISRHVTHVHVIMGGEPFRDV